MPQAWRLSISSRPPGSVELILPQHTFGEQSAIKGKMPFTVLFWSESLLETGTPSPLDLSLTYYKMLSGKLLKL